MEEVSRLRHTLHEVVSDVEPVGFRADIEAVLDDARLSPALLTVETVDALSDRDDLHREASLRGAGVQLSYEGLKLSRHLARHGEWTPGAATDDDRHIDLLVSEILVARGFYFLADTGVASQAVEIVRRFGRNMTNELQPDARPQEPSLEEDVLTLAVAAGCDLVTAADARRVSQVSRRIGEDLAAEPLPRPQSVTGRATPILQGLVEAQESDD